MALIGVRRALIRPKLALLAPYVGPGDVVSGAINWYGLRAYNAAYATGSNPACILVDQAGNNSITINILSNGTLDVATVAAWVVAHSVTTILITKVFDQIGTLHLVAATLAAMPTLVLGPITGLSSSRPAMLFSGSQGIGSANPVTQAQPLSFSAVAQRTNSSDGAVINAFVNPGAEMRFGPSTANQVFIFAGGTPATQSEADNSWHALQGVLNGASSVMNVDGSSGSTNNVGSAGFSSAGISMGNNVFNSQLTGFILEGGLWPFAFTGPNMSNLSSNQHSWNGF